MTIRCAIGLVVFVSAIASCARNEQVSYLDLATTTSVQNSGLLDDLLPAFTAESGLKVHVHAAGSGRSLQMLADQIVDAVITHAPATETRYLAQHTGWVYRKIAYNWFVVVGPPSDPARVRDAADVVDAFRRIARTAVPFVSRGDESGTHERELALWDAAGVKPPPDRLIISGRGMAQALRHADELSAYTLSDEATFWQLQPDLELAIVLRDDPRLLNTYAVVHPRDAEHAAVFAAWLTTGAGRDRMSRYQASGRPVFAVWPDRCPGGTPDRTPCLRNDERR